MSFKDKTFMINTLTYFHSLINDIATQLESSKPSSSATSEEDEELSETELLNKLANKSSFNILLIEFKTILVDSRFPSLYFSIFFSQVIPLFKSYCLTNIQNVDRKKSHYFWASFPTKTTNTNSFKLLEIYEYYEKLCKQANVSNVYPKIAKLIDAICEKYNEYLNLTENKLDLKTDLKNQTIALENAKKTEQNNIKKENKRNGNFLIIIPGILLAPLATMVFCYFNMFYLVLTIIDIVWLFIGISGKSNTCQVCGRWDSYVVVSEELLRSYVTTVEKTRYVNNNPQKYAATVTMDEIRQTLECKHCHDTRYVVKERER